MAVHPNLEPSFFKNLLTSKATVTLEEAIFRSETAFRPSNLQEFQEFWEQEILKEHPRKENLMKWISGATLEDFLNSFTNSEFQGKKLNSYYPQPNELPNYVPPEFETFMDSQVKEWVQNGALEEWDKVRQPGDPFIPVVVSPLGVEPSKPRALWDGRYVNEFCRDVPFSMDNASKMAEIAWGVFIFSR